MIKPLNDRVLVQRLESETQTASGLYIPETAKEKPLEGIVRAIGDGKVEDGKKIKLAVGKGDKVLFGKYSGTELTYKGEELLILREDEILAVIND